VITARNRPFQSGIILDAWRRAGRLLWCSILEDHEYEVTRGTRLNRLAGYQHTGITAWKEDLQESAWLQDDRPEKPEAKRN
jgi:hypothetical protein